MPYQNLDLDPQKFFCTRDRGTAPLYAHDLVQEKLHPQIYYKPSYCPSISLQDQRLGSCYQDYEVPTASFVFDDNSRCLPRIQPYLTLQQYQHLIYDSIFTSVQKIYETHEQVTLAFSGGIDSLVLLSFVIKLGVLARTDFLCMKNLTQTSPLNIHNHAGHRSNLKNLLSRFDRPTQFLEVTIDDFAKSFNHGDLNHCKCYCTFTMLDQLSNQAIMFGWHGNQILLHKAYFYDEMVDRRPGRQIEIQNHIVQRPRCYTQSVHHWQPQGLVPLRYRHLLVKPWMTLDQHNGNRVYGPIGSDAGFDALRQLDFDTVPCSIISDAGMARWMLHQNLGTMLDEFVHHESIHDIDNLDPFTVPYDIIDPDQIWIPDQLDHDTEGLSYLKDQILQARQIGLWPVNTLMVIKSLQWISGH